MSSRPQPVGNYDPKGWGDEPAPTRSPRPRAVLAGAVLAWVGTAFGTVIAVAFVTATSSSPLVSGLAPEQRQNAASFFHVVGIVLMTWCPVVALMAYFAFRRVSWAAMTVVVMGVVWILVSVFAALAGGGAGVLFGVAWTVASVTLIYFARPSRHWYDTAPRRLD